ncbi:MAG TPA: kelch repeat-containing protein [Candidatus Didemnitutus sp.]|nr:kelch repeat-containing protein [Candidatus Didemnitutus sp.]
MKLSWKRVSLLCLQTLLVFSLTQGVSQSQTKWRIFAELAQGRHHHAARYLNGDKIIVIGGYVNSEGILGGSPTTTTELVDLTSANVTPGPEMTYARCEFPTLVLPDGDILVFGGHSNNGGDNVIERFDVGTNTWSVVGIMQSSRRQHCADFLSSDEVLIFGGYGNSTAEIYTISTRQTASIAELPGPANSAVSINPDGRSPSFWGYRSGGQGSDRPYESIRYDKPTNTWRKDLLFDDKPVAPKLVTLADGSVLVISGALAESPFETSKMTWVVSPFGLVSRGPTLIEGRQWHVAGTWDNERILVAAGLVDDPNSDDANITASCEWLELSNNRSIKAPTLNVSRCFGQMILTRSKEGRMRAFAISGLTDTKNTPTIELLEDTVCISGTTMLDLSDFRLIGSAKHVGTRIELTSTEQFKSGAAWLRNKLPVKAGFDIRFRFRLINGNDNGQVDNGSPGADGIALVFQNSAPVVLGKPGDGIGYNELPHGVAVEFDSYFNAAFSDSSTSHIAVQQGDGRILRPWHVAPYFLGGNFKTSPSFKADGTVYHARVALDGTTLRVYCDTTGVLAEPIVTVPDVGIESLLRLDPFGACYVGFTSSTGKSSEVHEIYDVVIDGCQPLVSAVNENNDRSLPTMYVVPVPTDDAATLRLTNPVAQDLDCSIIDASGRVVARVAFPHDEIEVQLPIASMPVGAYRVIVRGGTLIHTLPLVISR